MFHDRIHSGSEIINIVIEATEPIAGDGVKEIRNDVRLGDGSLNVRNRVNYWVTPANSSRVKILIHGTDSSVSIVYRVSLSLSHD